MADRETTRDRLIRIAVEHGWTVAHSDPSAMVLVRRLEFMYVLFTEAGSVSSYAARQDKPGAKWQQASGPNRRAQVEAWLDAPQGGES